MTKLFLLSFVMLCSLGQSLFGQAIAPAPTSYYRLRFSFNTKSDWATLETSDPRVLLNRKISTQGNPSIYTMSTQKVAIGQPVSNAAAGSVVGVLVDYAIDPANLSSSPIVFTIRSGNINNTWAAIWNMNNSGFSFLQLADTLTMPGGGDKSFALNTSALAQLAPNQLAAWQTPAVEKMAWAFYYPWYPYIDNWNNSMLKDWPLQRYASGDFNSVTRQVQQAKSAGLNGFISSWAGPGTWTDIFLHPVLDAAQSQDFAVAPYVEILDDGGNPRSPATIVSWLTYLLAAYGNHPASYKVGGRPVVFVWSTQSLPLSTWASIFSQVRSRGYDAAFIGMGVDPADLQVFDGLHMYGFNGNEIASIFPDLKPKVKYYHLLADSWEPTRAKIWSPGIAPGYDETLIPGRAGRVAPRNGGAYYQSQWDILDAANPDWVAITSWNEFYENTHLEPSTTYSNQYLNLTGANVDRWRKH